MGYLFLSVDYPTDQIRVKYLQSISPNFRSVTFPIYQSLPANADIEDWKEILLLLQKSSSAFILDQPDSTSTEMLRPLKPNDDNYQAFIGPKWKRYSQINGGPSVPPQLAGFLGKALQSNDPTPHYDHCANCTRKQSTDIQTTTSTGTNRTTSTTTTTTKRCSRCKLVQYCSRECQIQHWKTCHQQSCIAAVANKTLWQALQTNDGFLITSDECVKLSKVLESCWMTKKEGEKYQYMIQGFASYFQFAADLGGCFVL